MQDSCLFILLRQRKAQNLSNLLSGFITTDPTAFYYALSAHQAFGETKTTGISAGPFISWGAYEKTADISEALSTYQYMHRLIGYYADRGVIITCDNHGWILTGVQPMSVNLATTIAEAMMEADVSRGVTWNFVATWTLSRPASLIRRPICLSALPLS